MIVHDLHGPLGAIMGASEILQEGILGPLTDDQKKWLFKIETASRRLLELVNHFLDLSRLEAGKVDLDKKEVNLNHLIQDTLDFYDEREVKLWVKDNGIGISSQQIGTQILPP